MKIVEVNSYALSTKVEEPFYYGEGWINSRNSMIVEVVTDEGIVGWGEGFCHANMSPHLAKAVVDRVLKPIVLGRSPWDVEPLWEKMYYETQPYGRKGIAISAISAIDVALWDCLGRALGKPVFALLGGAFRHDVEAYASGFFRSGGKKYPEADREEALSYRELGYKGMKLKGGFGVKEDIATVEAVRDAIGNDAKIMIDANCAYNAASARRLIDGLDGFGVHWLEEPLPPDDLGGYLEIKNRSSVLIAAGENEFTKYGYRDWIAQRALDILQPDLCFAGGFTECRKIAALAQAWHTSLMPHCWGSGIALAASMQFLATIQPAPSTFSPVEPSLEYDRSKHPFRQELIAPNIEMVDGRVPIPSGPGIGVEVDRGLILKYAN